MMNALPVLIVVWAVVTGLFLALLAYNATITRYEENQLFLDDATPTPRTATAVLDPPQSQQGAAQCALLGSALCHPHRPHHRHLHMGLLAEAPGQ